VQNGSLHSFWLPCTAEMLHQSLRHKECVMLRNIPLQHTTSAYHFSIPLQHTGHPTLCLDRLQKHTQQLLWVVWNVPSAAMSVAPWRLDRSTW